MAILLPMGMVGSEKTKLNRISGRYSKDGSQRYKKEVRNSFSLMSRSDWVKFLKTIGFHTVDETKMNEKIEKEINRQENSGIITADEANKYREYLMKGICVSSTYESMAENLIDCCRKYQMFKSNQIFYLLAQCLAEVGGDDDLIEDGGNDYLSRYVENNIVYCGAGYIQLTTGPNYIGFTHKRLNEELPLSSDPNNSGYPAPNLNSEKDQKGAGEARKNIIGEWKEKAMSVKGYTEEDFYKIAAIYLIGPPIVAKEYPWEASYYFWENRKIKEYINGSFIGQYASTFDEDINFIRMKIIRKVEEDGKVKETYYYRNTIQERDSNGNLTDINYTRCKKIEWNNNNTKLIIIGEMAWDEVHAEEGEEMYEITQALYRVSSLINGGDPIDGDKHNTIPKGLIRRKQALDTVQDYPIVYYINENDMIRRSTK